MHGLTQKANRRRGFAHSTLNLLDRGGYLRAITLGDLGMKRFGLALLATALAVLCVILFLLDSKQSTVPKGTTAAGSVRGASQPAPALAAQAQSEDSAQV